MSTTEELVELLDAHRPSDERDFADLPMCSCGHRLGWVQTWAEHVVDVLIASGDADEADKARAWLARGPHVGMPRPPALVRAVLDSAYVKWVIQVKQNQATEIAREEWREALIRSVTGPDMRLAEEKVLLDLKALIEGNPGPGHVPPHESGTCELCDYVEKLAWYMDERLGRLNGEDDLFEEHPASRRAAEQRHAEQQDANGARVYTDQEVAELARAGMAYALREVASGLEPGQSVSCEQLVSEAERLERSDQ